jgi:hypothetical protein
MEIPQEPAMKLLHVLIVAQLLAIASFAQNITGTVTGRVTDSAGATIADVAVTVTNAGTNLRFRPGQPRTVTSCSRC